MPNRPRTRVFTLPIKGDRVYAVWWPNRYGRVVATGPEIAEVQWDGTSGASYLGIEDLRIESKPKRERTRAR